MSQADDAWRVLEHQPMVQLAENLWWVQGALPMGSLKRAMTVARLSDGRLIIHNAIALERAEMEKLEDLGPPAVLVVPSGLHRLDAPAYKRRYPSLQVYAPSGARRRVAELVGVDGRYEDFPPDQAVSLETLDGVGGLEGVMAVRSRDGLTLVLNDIVFNMDRKRDPLGFLVTTLFGSAPGPRISRLARLMLVKDRAALKAALLRLAQLPGLTRLVVAHENVAHGGQARAALEQAAAYL